MTSLINITQLSLLLAVLMVSACSTTPHNRPAVLSPFGDGSQWVVWQDMKFVAQLEDKTMASIEVPRGFVTDLASTPRRFWAIYPPFGKYLSASILHDYLYWTQICERDVADSIFYQTMKASGVDQTTQALFLMVLRSQGAEAWRENKIDKQKGLVRIVPDEYLDPSNQHFKRSTDWPELRQTLLTKQVEEQAAPNKENMLRACSALSGSGKISIEKTQKTVSLFSGWF
ncbi:MAG: DUF1353 domain-containing protein [Bermanella sp.]